MIKEMQDKIIEKLEGITMVKTVGVWVGMDEEDLKRLLSTPQSYPALWVVYGGCLFGQKEVIGIGANRAPTDITFVIILINKNLRGDRVCSEECYEVIEEVRGKLTGLDVGAETGLLWPAGEELILAISGTLAYGLQYKVLTDEELTKEE